MSPAARFAGQGMGGLVIDRMAAEDGVTEAEPFPGLDPAEGDPGISGPLGQPSGGTARPVVDDFLQAHDLGVESAAATRRSRGAGLATDPTGSSS